MYRRNRKIKYHIKMTQLDRIERNSLIAAKEILTIKEAAFFLGVTPRTLYALTGDRKIAFYKPNNKMIYFHKKDLTAWLTRNRIASEEEVMDKAAAYNMEG